MTTQTKEIETQLRAFLSNRLDLLQIKSENGRVVCKVDCKHDPTLSNWIANVLKNSLVLHTGMPCEYVARKDGDRWAEIAVPLPVIKSDRVDDARPHLFTKDEIIESGNQWGLSLTDDMVQLAYDTLQVDNAYYRSGVHQPVSSQDTLFCVRGRVDNQIGVVSMLPRKRSYYHIPSLNEYLYAMQKSKESET